MWYFLIFVYFIFPHFFGKFDKEYDYSYIKPLDEKTELTVILKIYIPIYLSAIIFEDLESIKISRPLDAVRNLHWGMLGWGQLKKICTHRKILYDQHPLDF